MKKAIVLGLVVLLVIASAVAVHAKAQKVTLVPCPLNLPRFPENYPDDSPGGGFVVFNNSSGSHNLELTVSLKGALPNTQYDIYLFVDGQWFPVPRPEGGPIGTITTKARGNANFHLNATLTPGPHTVALDITLSSGTDVYETPGIHDGGGTSMTFK